MKEERGRKTMAGVVSDEEKVRQKEMGLKVKAKVREISEQQV